MPATAVLIDDSKTTRALLKVYLAEAGFQVVAEGDRGKHALPLYEKHQPTLLTLDIVLPGSMASARCAPSSIGIRKQRS